MSTNKQDDGLTEQSRRFIEAAREIEADEDSEAFRRRLNQLVKAPAHETTRDRKRLKAGETTK